MSDADRHQLLVADRESARRALKILEAGDYEYRDAARTAAELTEDIIAKLHLLVDQLDALIGDVLPAADPPIDQA